MPTKVQQEKKAQAKETIATSMEDLVEQVPNEEERNKMVLCGNAVTSKVKDSSYAKHKANIEFREMLDEVGAQFAATKERTEIRTELWNRVKQNGLTLFEHNEKAKEGRKWTEHTNPRKMLWRLLDRWKPKETAADSSSNGKKSSSTKQKSTPSNSGGNATAVLPSVATRTEGLPNNVSAIENSKMHATVDSPLRKKQKTSPTIDETKELQNRNKELEEENKALKKRCKALEDGNSMPTEKREASDAGRPDNIISEP